MANGHVSKELTLKFQNHLIEHGKVCALFQPSDGYAFSYGYVMSMLENNNWNEEEVNYRLNTFGVQL